MSLKLSLCKQHKARAIPDLPACISAAVTTARTSPIRALNVLVAAFT
jgi:hypothetical protein